MMEERKGANIRWLIHEGIRVRLQQVNTEKTIIWVSKESKNLILPLLLYDFLNRCKEELNLDIDINVSWNGHKGLIANNYDADIVIGEIIYFVTKWEIQPDEKLDGFSEDEWYNT